MIAAQLTTILGRALGDSPRARELCSELSGRRLRLEIRGTPLCFQVTAGEGSLRVERVSADGAAGADVIVRGAPFSLLAALAGEPEPVVARGGLELQGDDALARRFQALAALLRPDIESALAPLVGAMPAHLAARGLRTLQAWGAAAADAVLRDGADYLAHESRDLVPRAEAEGFLAGVGELQRSLGQLEARAGALGDRLDALAPHEAPGPREPRRRRNAP